VLRPHPFDRATLRGTPAAVIVLRTRPFPDLGTAPTTVVLRPHPFDRATLRGTPAAVIVLRTRPLPDLGTAPTTVVPHLRAAATPGVHLRGAGDLARTLDGDIGPPARPPTRIGRARKTPHVGRL